MEGGTEVYTVYMYMIVYFSLSLISTYFFSLISFFLLASLPPSLPPCLPPSQEPRLLDAADPGPLLPELAGEAAVRQGAGQSPADHHHTDQQDGGHVEGREGGGGEEAYMYM